MKTPPSIAILGGGAYNMSALQRLNEAGFRTVVLDGNRDAPGLAVADLPLVADIARPDEVVAALDGVDLDGVMPMNDFAVPSAARVAQIRELVGLSPSSAARATSKAQMRRAWEGAGLPNPAFEICRSLAEAIEGSGRLRFPLVMKPSLTGGGGRGIRIAENENELTDAWQTVRDISAEATVVIEEFVRGVELTVEAIAYRGQVSVLAISDKVRSDSAIHVASRLVYPANIDDDTENEVIQITQRAAIALGVSDGPLHLELILSDSGPVLLELGARGGGGHIFAPIVEVVSGVDMPVESARVLVGATPDLTRTASTACVYHLFTPRKGNLKSISGREEAASMPGLVAMTISATPGMRFTEPTDSLTRTGSVVVSGSSRGEALRRADHICDLLKFDYK